MEGISGRAANWGLAFRHAVALHYGPAKGACFPSRLRVQRAAAYDNALSGGRRAEAEADQIRPPAWGPGRTIWLRNFSSGRHKPAGTTFSRSVWTAVPARAARR